MSSDNLPGAPADGRKAGFNVRKEKVMKESTKDQVQGKLHEVKGKVKEKAGQLINSPDLEEEGQIEKTAGKVQKKIGQIEEVLGI